jgi:hypothetical protein
MLSVGRVRMFLDALYRICSVPLAYETVPTDFIASPSEILMSWVNDSTHLLKQAFAERWAGLLLSTALSFFLCFSDRAS